VIHDASTHPTESSTLGRQQAAKAQPAVSATPLGASLIPPVGEALGASRHSSNHDRRTGECDRPCTLKSRTLTADFGDADHAVRLKSISQFGRRRSPGSDEGDH
jgi:hypothetical protein